MNRKDDAVLSAFYVDQPTNETRAVSLGELQTKLSPHDFPPTPLIVQGENTYVLASNLGGNIRRLSRTAIPRLYAQRFLLIALPILLIYVLVVLLSPLQSIAIPGVTRGYPWLLTLIACALLYYRVNNDRALVKLHKLDVAVRGQFATLEQHLSYDVDLLANAEGRKGDL